MKYISEGEFQNLEKYFIIIHESIQLFEINIGNNFLRNHYLKNDQSYVFASSKKKKKKNITNDFFRSKEKCIKK